MSIKRKLHAFAQKLLFLWVRVETLPKDIQRSNWGDKPVLYVLAARGLSELLVLESMSRKLNLPDPLEPLSNENLNHHAIYSIASSSPVSDWLLKQKKRSFMLDELLKTIQHDENFDITIIPVSIFWGRPIAKQRHWLKVLFSDTWAVAGRIRKLFTLLINGRHTTLIFSPPKSFRSLAAEANFNAETMNDLLSGHLRSQREATFGPELANRNKIIEKIVHSEAIQSLIKTDTSEKTTEKSRKKAVRYSREIFSNCTQISQELMKRLLNVFWNRFFSGIKIFNIDPVKKIALTHQLVYVPCHRSHVDYLLLSYVIFHEGLALPYIAAGNNLDMPIIGRLLRGGGAFFIRRSFKDNPMYSAIMKQYVHELIELGVPIEYFIEGGRSRTGRLLKPKHGMLSMTVEGWIKTQKKPLAFIPVYIGYEKLIEGRSYVGELYGEKKEKESLLSSIRSILKLKGQFGKVTARFGTPIKIDSLLHEVEPDWKSDSHADIHHRSWFRSSIEKLSHEIMLEINRAAVINPVNLIATTLLATPRQSIDQNELLQQCDFYQAFIKSQPFLESVLLQDKVSIDELERIQQQGLINIMPHPLGDIIHLKHEHAVLMSYYRNNSLHTLIIPSLIACCFINARNISTEKVIHIVRYIYPFLASELHLPWNQQELDEFIPSVLNFLLQKQVIVQHDDGLKRPDRSDENYLILSRLAQIAQPILERYYMTYVVLLESIENPLKEKDLEQRCHLMAQKISMVYGINSPDFFDRLLFRHFLDTLFELDFIRYDEDGYLIFIDQLGPSNMDIRSLLSIEVRSTILQLLKSGQNQSRITDD